MSEPGFDPDHPHDAHDPEPEDGLLPQQDRHQSRRRLRGCIPVLIAFVVIVVALVLGGRWALDQLNSRFAAAPDYEGPGYGQVMYEVKEGATSAEIGRDLKAKGVVKSVDAFTAAANENEKSRNIQVGFYRLKKHMQASEALDVLVDPDNLMQSVVVVPEGARVRQIVDSIVEHTDISRKAVTRALADGTAIGLPPEARGNPEGYLFPATYTVSPKQTATGLLSQMVEKAKQTEQELGVAAKAPKLGLTPEQVITVASILEYEANREEDYPKVARVLYNRLHQGMPLQLDSTVSYVSKRQGDVWTTSAERSDKSAYNTYQHKGLPPGPIGSPGTATLKAALNPAPGNWLYFVPDYQAHTTRFSHSYAEHQKWVDKLREYCRTHQEC